MNSIDELTRLADQLVRLADSFESLSKSQENRIMALDRQVGDLSNTALYRIANIEKRLGELCCDKNNNTLQFHTRF